MTAVLDNTGDLTDGLGVKVVPESNDNSFILAAIISSLMNCFEGVHL